MSVYALAASSVKQAEALPTVSLMLEPAQRQHVLARASHIFCLQRALLRWMLLATKLLRRLHISEHLQVRYRTARMLEIWDLAASSMPASPVSPMSTSSLMRMTLLKATETVHQCTTDQLHYVVLSCPCEANLLEHVC